MKEYLGIKIERCFLSKSGTGQTCKTQQGWNLFYPKMSWVPSLKRAKVEIDYWHKRWREGTLTFEETHPTSRFLRELWGEPESNPAAEERSHP